MHCAGRLRGRPVADDLHLRRVHGDPLDGDHVSRVGQRGLTERALAALDENPMMPQLGEDSTKVANVICPCPAVNKDVVKKTSTNHRRNGRRTSFINAWNVARALQRPKGMTRNS